MSEKNWQYYVFIGMSIVVYTIVIVILLLLGSKLFKQGHRDPNIIKESLIPDSGKGVFASKDYKKDDIVEECNLLLDNTDEITNTIINDYSWSDDHNGEKVTIIPITGKCNMFNHSDNFSIDTSYDLNTKIMILRANTDIKEGEEMYNSYGDGYWESRQKN